jgi:hypothetical protein
MRATGSEADAMIGHQTGTNCASDPVSEPPATRSRPWRKLADLLHRATSTIVLAVLFYLLLTPFALLVRLARHDPLRLRPDRETKTYWIERDHPAAPDTMKRQF